MDILECILIKGFNFLDVRILFRVLFRILFAFRHSGNLLQKRFYIAVSHIVGSNGQNGECIDSRDNWQLEQSRKAS